MVHGQTRTGRGGERARWRLLAVTAPALLVVGVAAMGPAAAQTGGDGPLAQPWEHIRVELDTAPASAHDGCTGAYLDPAQDLGSCAGRFTASGPPGFRDTDGFVDWAPASGGSGWRVRFTGEGSELVGTQADAAQTAFVLTGGSTPEWSAVTAGNSPSIPPGDVGGPLAVQSTCDDGDEPCSIVVDGYVRTDRRLPPGGGAPTSTSTTRPPAVAATPRFTG